MKGRSTQRSNHRIIRRLRAIWTHQILRLQKAHGFRDILIMSMVCIFFIFISAAGASDQKAGTLTELIKMFDSSSCKECHEEIHSQWETSHHARSIMGIFMDRYLQKGVLSVKNPNDATKKNFPCFKCHFPQLEYATDEVASEIAAAILSKDKATMSRLNINCLVCHNQKGVIHGHPEKGMLYGTDSVSEHPDEGYKKVKASPIMKRSVMCGQCHGLGPNFEFEHPVQCATLYGSYLHAYVPSGGAKTCQECHMKDADHSCPPDFNKRDEVSARLKKALPMEVDTLIYKSQFTPGKIIPMLVVKTKITSKAGHRIPDG